MKTWKWRVSSSLLKNSRLRKLPCKSKTMLMKSRQAPFWHRQELGMIPTLLPHMSVLQRPLRFLSRLAFQVLMAMTPKVWRLLLNSSKPKLPSLNQVSTIHSRTFNPSSPSSKLNRTLTAKKTWLRPLWTNLNPNCNKHRTHQLLSRCPLQDHLLCNL